MQPKKKHGVGHNKNFGKSHTHRSLLCNASAYPLGCVRDTPISSDLVAA